MRRLISLQIAVQTDVWFVLSEDDKRKCLNFKFRPIDLAEIKWRLESEKKAVHQYRQLLAESGVNFLEIWYEDLYDPALTPERHVDVLNRIVAFLGRKPLTHKAMLPRLHDLFEPSKMKLNSPETYRRIPGIEELEQQCGSDETGWVFKNGGI